MAAMKKLHKQFRHAPIRNVVSLVKASQVEVDPKMLDEVASDFECDACIQFEVKKPNPVAKMPRDHMFNREIPADVFCYKGEPILRVMCTFNAYCQAVLIVSVTGAAVVRCLIDHWICYFSRTEVLFCDLGSEFVNGKI